MTSAPTETRAALCLGLAVLLFAQGCASYTARPAPIPSVQTVPVSRTVGSVTAGADPYVSDERKEMIFELFPSHVLPIQVFVENHGTEFLSIRYSDVILEFPKGGTLRDDTRQSPLHPIDFMSLPASGMPQPTSSRVVGGSGGSGNPVFHSPVRYSTEELDGYLFLAAVAAVLLVAPAALIWSANRDHKARLDSAREADYLAKELPDTTIAPGATVHGFVYFAFPRDVPTLSGAALIVRLGGSQADRFSLEIRLPLDSLTDRASTTSSR